MRRFVDWFFRDSHTGAIVIGQWPNLALWLFAGASVLAWLTAGIEPSWIANGLQAAAAVSLAWWALDEILRGVNPWRRCLGSAVLLYGLWSLASRL